MLKEGGTGYADHGDPRKTNTHSLCVLRPGRAAVASTAGGKARFGGRW
jgi:hypothetical protein